MTSYSTTVKRNDHFEPEDSADPAVQRKRRGHLEQIDYTAYACNREVIAQTLPHVDAQTFQRMAVVAAHARAQWVAEAVAISATGLTVTPDRIARLSELHKTFEEVSEAYEALRRMVERGYVHYRG
jgi:long-subunit acyl-CoA synthetase (AMP-forming)